jgi:sporulation protein YlmC with PRC-barrel domain
MKIKKISEVLGKNVFTDAGDFIGQIEEANLVDNRIEGWRIRVVGQVSNMIGGARGLIAPHSFVKSIGDVFVMSKTVLPIREDMDSAIGNEELSETY